MDNEIKINCSVLVLEILEKSQYFTLKNVVYIFTIVGLIKIITNISFL